MSLYGAGVLGRGEVSADCVKQSLHTLVLERRAAEHRVDGHRECALADGLADFLFGDCGGVVEVFLHQSLVELCESLKHLVAVFLSLLKKVARDFLYRILCAHSLVVPEVGLHGDQVDHTLESLLGTDRQLNRKGICAQHFLHLTHNLEEVGARAVHLVDITDTRHIIFVSLTPYSLRLRLHTAYGAECSHGAVEHTQRALHLYSEVHVSRSVNQVDFEFFAVIVPECCGSGRCDSDTTLLLLLHPVHCSRAVVHLTDFVSQAGIKKDALRSSSLAGIDVGHDADIAGIFKFVVFSHCMSLLLKSEVSERTVSLCHAVHVLFTLVSAALIIESVDDFGSQLVGHGLAATLAGEDDEVFH